MIASNLEVNLHGQLIGNITYLGGDRSIFAFNDDYINDKNRKTLSLSFKNQMGELITNYNSTQTKLLPFFSNLLPEGHLRKYLSGLLNLKSGREYSLISALGHDLSGAVTVVPSDYAHNDETIAENTLPNIDNEPQKMRFSLAGVQLKFSAIEKATGGLTIPARGDGGSWIIKLPSMRFTGVSENEFSMMSLAKMIGIDVPEFKLIKLSDIEGLPKGIEKIEEDAYAIKRFDRQSNGAKIHIEDFAQIFGLYPDDKYQKLSYRNIAQVLWIEDGEKSVIEFIRRVVFNTLIGNADMHAKNWSVIYKDGRNATIAPAYDFVSTITYLEDEDSALKYARTKKMKDLDLGEIAYMAAKAGIPEKLATNTAKATVDRFKEVWQAEKNNLALSKKAQDAIDEHSTKVKIYSE